jgi:hypothetical protein
LAEPILLQARYRNKLERAVGEQLHAAGISFDYEGEWIEYDVPARKAKYLPDFRPRGTNIILETKGWFGRQGAKERQKLILLKEQHPELDIRIVFSDARKPIYKGSPTTYAQWATDHGFTYSDKGMIPKSWHTDLKRQTCKLRPSQTTSGSRRKRARSSRTSRSAGGSAR